MIVRHRWLVLLLLCVVRAVALSRAGTFLPPEHQTQQDVALNFNDVDCMLRALTYEYANALLPTRRPLLSVKDALRLAELCPTISLPSQQADASAEQPASSLHLGPGQEDNTKHMSYSGLFVDPREGADDNLGTLARPLRSLHAALQASRALPRPAAILLQPGTHYISKPLELGPQDSGLRIAAAPGPPGPTPHVISGGFPLIGLPWRPCAAIPGAMVAPLPPKVPCFSALYVGDRRAVRARYPNGDPATSGHHTLPTCLLPGAAAWLPPKPGRAAFEMEVGLPRREDHYFQTYKVGLGGPAAPFSPAASYWACNSTQGGDARTYSVPSGLVFDNETFSPRVGRWSDPSSGVVHAFHGGYWGGWAFEVDTVDAESSTIHFARGGWQEARGLDKGGEWYIENILEELDAPGEWFLDCRKRLLYYHPNTTDDVSSLQFTAAVHQKLVVVSGSQEEPVAHVEFRGIMFAHTAPTFMEPYEVPSGGDWAIHRGAAVELRGVRDVLITNCTFSWPSGNGLLLSGYTRNVRVLGNEIAWAGDSAIVIAGTAHHMDASSGDVPSDTLIEGNLIHEVGIFGKQAGAVFQALAERTVLRGNVMFNGPRAAVNFNDGHGGGNIVQGNAMFNWVRETADHGIINSWDRLPYIMRRRRRRGTASRHCSDGGCTAHTSHHAEQARSTGGGAKDWGSEAGEADDDLTLTPDVTTVTGNLLLGNYHTSFPVDHDDGTCYYHTERNVLAYGGFKDYLGHTLSAVDNLYVYPDADISVRRDFPARPAYVWPHTPYCAFSRRATPGQSGYGNVWKHNTCVLLNSNTIYKFYAAKAQEGDSGWRELVPDTDLNTFFTPDGTATVDVDDGTIIYLGDYTTASGGYDSRSGVGRSGELKLEELQAVARDILGLAARGEDLTPER